jgi:hypothetical protein
MAFTLYGGRATWDHAGKATPTNEPAIFEWFELATLVWTTLL